MKIALLCSGLGHVLRGHETFARQLVDMLGDSVDLTVFKGGGVAGEGEILVPCLQRGSALLQQVHAKANPRWADAVADQERHRIEAETFAYAALEPLMAGGYEVIHCLEREVCAVLHRERHLFARPPRLLFSNGGAIPARDLPPCDAVQEHTDYNARYSARDKAVVIPHGVDLQRFYPGVAARDLSDLGLSRERPLAISVGTICRDHKRMDHVIDEIAQLPDWQLLIVGQESPQSEAIRRRGREKLGTRVAFASSPHAELPAWYAAADAFVLGSSFETFGIVYIEAMAMGLPVFCTEHANQRSIVQEGGQFVNMLKPGALAEALRRHNPDSLRELGRRGRAVAERDFDLAQLPGRYQALYRRLADMPAPLPQWSHWDQWRARLHKLMLRMDDRLRGRAEQ